jgi:hypothetical protein
MFEFNSGAGDSKKSYLGHTQELRRGQRPKTRRFALFKAKRLQTIRRECQEITFGAASEYMGVRNSAKVCG